MNTPSTFDQTLPASPPDMQDRLCAKHDAARMIRQLRQRAGLSETQFAARLGMKVKDVLVAEIGAAGYQRTYNSEDLRKFFFMSISQGRG